MNGLALTILVGQLPKLFGFSVDAEGLIGEVDRLPQRSGERRNGPGRAGDRSGRARPDRGAPATAPQGSRACLVVVVLSITAAALFDLADHGVSLVGVLPQGFPPLTIPDVGLADLVGTAGGARWASRWSRWPTRSRPPSPFAARTGQEVDGNREMIGIGAANLGRRACSRDFRSARAVPGPPSPAGGAKSQVTGLVGAAAITLILLFVPGLLRNLPQPTLAAVVIAASISLADIPGTRAALPPATDRVRAVDRSVPRRRALGVLPGIAIAVALSIGNVFRRAWRPYQTVLGRVPGVPGYHDMRSYPDAERLPGCVSSGSTRPCSSPTRGRSANRSAALARSEPAPQWIIVAAEPITDVDTTAADMLEDLDEALNARASASSSPR